MLHCYRWQACDGAASSDVPAEAGPGAEAGQEEGLALRELLTSLQQLGLLLPEALPAGLPAFTLSAPASAAASAAAAAEKGASGGPAVADAAAVVAEAAPGAGQPSVQAEPCVGGSPPNSGGWGRGSPASIQVRLVPAGTLQLSCEQQQLLLGCSHALVAHMFARGRYCGAAGKLVAADPPAGQVATESTAGAAKSLAAGEATAGRAAASLAPAAGLDQQIAASQAQPLPLNPAAEPDSQMTDGTLTGNAALVLPSGQQQSSRPELQSAAAEPGAEPGSAEDAQAAEAAGRLVRNALHRVLLLHDGRGLPRSKRARRAGPASPLEAGAAEADEAGFLLVPLAAAWGSVGAAEASAGVASSPAGGSKGSRDDSRFATLIDWHAVQDIAAAASFQGTLLDWLQHQAAGEGCSAAKAQSPAGSTPAKEQPSARQPDSAALRRALGGRVLVTTYNNSAYLYRWGPVRGGFDCHGS